MCRKANPEPTPFPSCLQSGRTALHVASERGHLGAVERLVAAGVDVGARDQVRADNRVDGLVNGGFMTGLGTGGVGSGSCVRR